MLNFSVGPVMSHEDIKKIAYNDVPYFRTTEFSNTMLENEKILKEIAGAGENCRVAVMTGSGTLSMEAIMLNTIKKDERVLIINGGTFGQRFCNIASVYGFEYDEIKLEFGKSLKKEHLDNIDGSIYSAVYVNADETSSGLLYDLKLIGEFCKKYSLFFVVDAISAFLADDIKMDEWGIDALIIGSQKALALHPGISILILSEKAQIKVEENENPVFYMSLKNALNDAKRGQTPFTPAVGVILQLEKRLNNIKEGGIDKEIKKVKDIANYFREKVKKFNLYLITENMSNAVTALKVPNDKSAKKIFEILKDEYNIWVCPNGGELADEVFRVGHIGNITKEDIDKLITSFEELEKRGIL